MLPAFEVVEIQLRHLPRHILHTASNLDTSSQALQKVPILCTSSKSVGPTLGIFRVNKHTVLLVSDPFGNPTKVRAYDGRPCRQGFQNHERSSFYILRRHR